MEIITGPALSNKVDYSFGDHHAGIDPTALIGGFVKEANPDNREFIDKCKEFEGKVMTLYIDNVRLYNRGIWAQEGGDAQWIKFLLDHNDLLRLCATLPNNKFIIFSHQEDTIIDKNIVIPENVLGVYAVNAEYETDRLYAFPFGAQRQLGADDHRLEMLKEYVEKDEHIEPTKLFYISGCIDRNEERKPLADFGTNEWATTRFDKFSRFYPYEQYNIYLDEIKDHKFVACPRGHDNCYDTHKIWESLYMRRVPVFRDWPYYKRLMQEFPVLFVKEWLDITPQFLKDNDYLYQEAQKMSLKKLDLSLIYEVIVKSYE